MPYLCNNVRGSAINPIGQIVPNECIYCLKCQANYFDPNTCLPLKQRALRRLRRKPAKTSPWEKTMAEAVINRRSLIIAAAVGVITGGIWALAPSR